MTLAMALELFTPLGIVLISVGILWIGLRP